MTSRKKPSDNAGLINALRPLLALAIDIVPTSLVWIRGHCGAGGNERVDRLAKGCAKLSVTGFTLAEPTMFLASCAITEWTTPLALHCSTPLQLFLSNLPTLPGPDVLWASPLDTEPATLPLRQASRPRPRTPRAASCATRLASLRSRVTVDRAVERDPLPGEEVTLDFKHND